MNRKTFRLPTCCVFLQTQQTIAKYSRYLTFAFNISGICYENADADFDFIAH